MNDLEKPTEYHDIILTDIQLHTVKARKPEPWYKRVWRSIKSGKPGRFYGRDLRVKKDGTFEFAFPLPPNIQKEVDLAKKSGKKLRLLMPEGGIPIYPDPDVIEYLKAKHAKDSKNKTRVWRS